MKSIFVFAVAIAFATGKFVPEQKYQISFPTGRIVGGVDAPKHSAPYIASLHRSDGHFCGGSIIAKDWVLSAGHCLYLPKQSITVVAGRHNIKLNSESTEQRRSIDFYVVHEDYSGNVGPYDVGVVHLTKDFEFNQYVQPIGLPEPEYIHSGDVKLFGWGSVSKSIFPNYPSILQTVDLPIVEYNECERALGGRGATPLHPTNVCTGPLTGGISACSGDSGGPLVQKQSNGELEQVGIVSWGYIPCGGVNRPSVYTRVSAHHSWIRERQAYYYMTKLMEDLE